MWHRRPEVEEQMNGTKCINDSIQSIFNYIIKKERKYKEKRVKKNDMTANMAQLKCNNNECHTLAFRYI